MNAPWRAGLAVAAIALLLRVPVLSQRPVHADEAIQADRAGALLANLPFHYQARDYHGIVLAGLAALVNYTTGATDLSSLTEFRLRIVPALAGAALAGLVAAYMSFWGGLLVALSPGLVYWSRDFIPEMLLALASAILLFELRRQDAARWWVAGLAAGVMLATKDTAFLSLVALTIALLACRRQPFPAERLWHAVALCVFTTTFLLSNGLRELPHLAAEVAALPQALGARTFGSAHAHPWWFYFSVLRWELFLLPLAIWRGRTERFLLLYALSLLLLYIVLPYKTPWCAVQWWWPLLALATPPKAWQAGVVALILSTGFFVRPTPYAYSETHPAAQVFAARTESLAREAQQPIQVFSTQNLWPLPWYWRRYANQQWRRAVDPTADPSSIIVVTPELEPDLVRWLYEQRPPGQRPLYRPVFSEPIFLRPDIELRLYCTGAVCFSSPRNPRPGH